MNKDLEDKTEEIERLKAIIIMQENSNKQMQTISLNRRNIQKDVENFLEDYVQGIHDKRERVTEIEIFGETKKLTTIQEV